MEDSIKSILSTIDEAIAKFQGEIPGIQKLVFDELQPIIKQIQTKDGKLLNSVDNLKLIGNLKNKLQAVINNITYTKSVSDFIDSFNLVSNLQQEYFKQFNQQFKPNKTLPIIKQLAVEQTINDLVGQGMSSNIIDPIKSILTQNITTGGSYVNFQDQLRNHILSNETGEGSLERYTKQITTDAINQYNAQFHDAIAQDFNFSWGRYVGSNIKTSREFCILLTKKQWVKRDELPEILKGHIDGHDCKLSKTTGLPLGMIPDTNVDNFKVLRGGYNCGHQFFWVPDSSVPAGVINKVPSSTFVDLEKVNSFAGTSIDPKLYNNLKEPVEVSITDGGGSYYNPTTEEIVFDKARWPDSSIHKPLVTYHEFGHALHYQNNIIRTDNVSKEFETVYKSAKKSLMPTIDNTMKVARQLLADYDNPELIKKYGFETSDDIEESVTVVYDIIGSLTKGRYGGGHSVPYYNNNNGAYAELFAHGNYLHFSSNKLIEELLPGVTNTLSEYFKNFHQ